MTTRRKRIETYIDDERNMSREAATELRALWAMVDAVKNSVAKSNSVQIALDDYHRGQDE